VSGGEHVAARPSWDCGRCGKPWPCDLAREQFAAEMTRTELAVMMSVDMVEAARDDDAIMPSELFDRFLAWTRIVPASPSKCSVCWPEGGPVS
jgi:hypothetical protein